jgi:hypothetical protein
MRCKSCSKNWAATGFVSCRVCRRRAAGVLGMRGAATPLEIRLWGRLRVVGDCWEWEGALTAAGYAGGIMYRKRRELAYRWALILTVGDPPPGHEADHYCHNPKCCRPDHLGWVTREQNNGICVRQPQDERRRKYNAYQRKYQREWRAARKLRAPLGLDALRAAAALLPRA